MEDELLNILNNNDTRIKNENCLATENVSSTQGAETVYECGINRPDGEKEEFNSKSNHCSTVSHHHQQQQQQSTPSPSFLVDNFTPRAEDFLLKMSSPITGSSSATNSPTAEASGNVMLCGNSSPIMSAAAQFGHQLDSPTNHVVSEKVQNLAAQIYTELQRIISRFNDDDEVVSGKNGIDWLCNLTF